MPEEDIDWLAQFSTTNHIGLHFCDRNNRPYPPNFFDAPDDPDMPDSVARPGHQFLLAHAAMELQQPTTNDTEQDRPVNVSNTLRESFHIVGVSDNNQANQNDP